MKQALYFSHDSNARNDIKMLALRDKYGSKGYGCFWILIELMREADGHFVTLNPLTVTVLRRELQMKPTELNEFLNDCIEWGLFVKDGDNLFSNSLNERMQLYADKVAKASAAGKQSAYIRQQKRQEAESLKPAPIQQNLTNVEQTSNARSTNKTKQNKTKQIKTKQIKTKNADAPILELDLPSIVPKIDGVDNVKLSDAEYKKLSDAHGDANAKKMIQLLSNYKHQSGRNYKSDYHAILNWVVERVMQGNVKHRNDQHENALRKRLDS